MSLRESMVDALCWCAAAGIVVVILVCALLAVCTLLGVVVAVVVYVWPKW